MLWNAPSLRFLTSSVVGWLGVFLCVALRLWEDGRFHINRHVPAKKNSRYSAGSQMAKSMWACCRVYRHVASFWFMRHRLVFNRKFAISCPLLSVFVQPHKLSWALKSPRKSTGEGSCDINEIRSVCVHVLDGGKYIEQSVIDWGVETRRATAWNEVFKGMASDGQDILFWK